MSALSQLQKETTIILLASGDSSRFLQNNLPKKQWLRLGKLPLWRDLVDRFAKMGFEKIFVTFCKQEVKYARGFFPNIIEGGASRTESILKALQKVNTSYVLIQDVARFQPLEKVINELFEKAVANPQLCCIAPRMKIADTLYHQEGYYPKREDFFAIQTPQLSKTKDLKLALQKGDFSDESSAIKANGGQVDFVEGSTLMHKITYPYDLFHLKSYAPDFVEEKRVGNGLDIHGFEEDKKMLLCGVEIESPFGFRAHSDGDVGIHSLIDGILGAIGAGDIGEWFPDTDVEFRGIDSKILLQEVLLFAKNVGYEIGYVDLTILAQVPKILPYKDEMKQTLSRILNLAPHQINLKATTGENLGFIGRKEGVCVLSNVEMKTIDWSKNL